jgi:hypothetical protein
MLGNKFMIHTKSKNGEVLLFDGIGDEDSFLRLAKEFGTPIRHPNGSYIKTLRVTCQSAAPVNSLSARYGTGMFPFHTDTAFWNPPARLVLLRGVNGDLRRPTFIKPFNDLFEGVVAHHLRRSIWICDTGKRKFYTTLSFENHDEQVFRYDPNCMRAANSKAQEIEILLRERCSDLRNLRIEWKPNRVAIIRNWTHLHARGFPFDGEQGRTLQRIYIR